MSQSNDLDPFELWRKALSSLESNFNQFSNQALRSDEVTQSMSRLSTAAVGLQSSWDAALARYFKTVNIATRTEVMEIAAALQRIEEKIDRLLPAERSLAPKPARTRQPPGAVMPAAAEASVAPAAAPRKAASTPSPRKTGTPAPRKTTPASPRRARS